jgi:hypothetical protein
MQAFNGNLQSEGEDEEEEEQKMGGEVIRQSIKPD